MARRLLQAALLIRAAFTTAAQDLQRPDPIDLGYAVYQGYVDDLSGGNYYPGIRYAAPPLGARRWARTEPPEQTDREVIQLPKAWPPQCPQTPAGSIPNAYSENNEDCLYLTVITPPGQKPDPTKKLPVLMFIHGGGYAGGFESYNFNEMFINNGRQFLIVLIQYRLGAFGYLSSAEMGKFGAPNAGLWDQAQALQWIQDHIASFGGDPRQVTISGESAGAGSVMGLTMADNGKWGSKYFSGVIVNSPYLPQQWDFDGDFPTRGWSRFVQAAGCGDGTQDLESGSTLACLRSKDSSTLQRANYDANVPATADEWTFLPVTDGQILFQTPSQQFQTANVNGNRLLSGHNANEGANFVAATITTQQQFEDYLAAEFPHLSDSQREEVNKTYAIASVQPNAPLFATDGISEPTALNQSNYAVGQQQRAYNMYAEYVFICSSYWMADAFALKGQKCGKINTWMYQFSVLPSQHGLDLNAYTVDGYIQPGGGTMCPAFRKGMQQIWGQFVITGNPTLSSEMTDALRDPQGSQLEAAHPESWSGWGEEGTFRLINLNMTETTTTGQAKWSIADAVSWEGGRGARCDFWQDLGPAVPE